MYALICKEILDNYCLLIAGSNPSTIKNALNAFNELEIVREVVGTNELDGKIVYNASQIGKYELFKVWS
jgi:Fe2+ or Zn2+ uptake regulation protein